MFIKKSSNTPRKELAFFYVFTEKKISNKTFHRKFLTDPAYSEGTLLMGFIDQRDVVRDPESNYNKVRCIRGTK